MNWVGSENLVAHQDNSGGVGWGGGGGGGGGGGTPGGKGAGSLREAGKDRAGSEIPKMAGTGSY